MHNAKLIFIIPFCLVTIFCRAQRVREKPYSTLHFKEYATSIGIVYNSPSKDWVQVNPDNSYAPTANCVIGSRVHEDSCINKDLLISIDIVDYPKTDTIEEWEIKNFGYFGNNLNFLRIIQATADKSKDIYFYSTQDANKLFHADNATIYVLRNTGLYKKKYSFCKVLTIHKKNVADICLYFWCTGKEIPYLEKIITEAHNLIMFK